MERLERWADLDRPVLRYALRTDLTTFIGKTFSAVDGSHKFSPNWHIELIAEHLESAARGEIRRLLITLPPRSLKSICASVAFPAWLLGNDSRRRILCASYSGELANKHARDCRRVMQAAWYQQVFPQTRLNHRKSAEHDFETTAQGVRLATSVEGTVTGRGGDFLIVDDPIKPADALSSKYRATVKEWFDGTLFSRLDDKKTGVIIVIMQRLHVDDLVGHLLEKGDWVHLHLPSIADADEFFTLADGRILGRRRGEALHARREPLETLLKIKETIGEYHFSAQYQQNPVPECGNLIKSEWFQTYEALPLAATTLDRIVQSWDVAMTMREGSDFSVCTTWAVRGNRYYLVDVLRERMEFPSLKRRVFELKQQHNAKDVLIEDAAIGTSLIQQLRAEGRLYPIAIRPEGAKSDRMAAQSSVIEAGRVFLPAKAHWLGELRSELAAFPLGRHDDQVDSLSQFLGWITAAKRGIQIIGMF